MITSSRTAKNDQYGRKVYHAAARWRAYACIFLIMGVAFLLIPLYITWSDGIESGDLHPIAGALAVGLLIGNLCLWAFNLVFSGSRLVVAPEGIGYYSAGISLVTTWNDVIAVDSRVAGASMQRGLLLGHPVMRVRGLAGWLAMFGMAVSPRTNRQALSRFAVTGQILPPIDLDTFTRFIPLSFFRPNWENEALGDTVRHFAPQAFGGQPAASTADTSVAQSPAAVSSALSGSAPGSLKARHIPVWAKLIGVVVLEIAFAAGLLMYAGNQVLPVRTLSSDVSDSSGGLAFSPDSTLLASANGISNGRDFAFSPDGKSLAASNDVQLWSASSGKPVRDLTYTGPTNGIVLRRVSDWAPLRTLLGAGGYVQSVVFTPDSRLVVAGSGESAVRAWRAADGALLHIFRWAQGSDDPITSIALFDGGKSIVANFGPDDSILSGWRLSDGRALGDSSGCYAVCSGIFTLAGSQDGTSLAVGSLSLSDSPGQVAMVGGGGAQLASYSTEGKTAYSLAFSPDGRLLAAGMEDGHVRVWRVRDGALLATLYLGTKGGGVSAVAISPNDREIAASDEEGPLRMWDISRVVL
jgi:WD40 repeat protein